ncbi:MAG: DUF5977 domain-containing protein [Janthinobacterium lividum]
MLSPHVFPIVAHPGPAPELSARSGQGGWEPYALAAPADRLLPFVLTRLIAPGQGRWVNCATIVHADTEAVIAILSPTGQTVGGPAALGLVLQKVVDQANLREHFIYTGAAIPALNLPCGVPLRLLLDNGWQSARFMAVVELSGPPDGVSATYQRLEWSHPGPLSGIPYGTGFTQRLYLENAGLQYASPREVEQSSQDATTGIIRQDYLAQYERRTTNVALAPRYLTNAMLAARAHRTFRVDNQRWKLVEVKETVAGTDGGRWTLALTLEDLEPLQSRLSCPADPLPAVVFDPVADAPRLWHCGDTSDTAPDYQPTGATSCELANGINTGYVLLETEDLNPYSHSAGQSGPPIRNLDPVACPVPVVYQSAAYSDFATRNDCQSGYLGSVVVFSATAGQFTSTVDQSTADGLAYAFVQAGKQAYANQQGTCTLGRRISLQNIVVKTKQVQFDLVRTDSSGDVTATVTAYAITDDGSGNPSPRQFTVSFTIPAGSTQLSTAIGYQGGVLVEFQQVEIQYVTPIDYQY